MVNLVGARIERKEDFIDLIPKTYKQFHRKDKLKKFNVSILDISSEYPKEATVAIVFAAHNEKQAIQIREKIEKFLYKNFPEIEFFIDVEVI